MNKNKAIDKEKRLRYKILHDLPMLILALGIIGGVGIVIFPKTGVKGVLNSLCMGIVFLCFSVVLKILVFRNIGSFDKKHQRDKYSIKKIMLTLLFSVLLFLSIILGLYLTVNSIIDLASGKTENIILIDAEVTENRGGKGYRSYTLRGTDKDGNQYSFNVEKDDKWAHTRKDEVLSVTYYAHTEVVKKLEMVKNK